MDFNVDLSVFRGPLDLLLYLVRKHEVDLIDIPIAEVAEQFLEFLDVLKELDVAAAGDFLAMASTLVELKSQQVLPHTDEEVEDEVDSPRQELVRRLLEYKQYRDAASILEERSRQWQLHFQRQTDDLQQRGRDLASEPIREVELWDLVSAFGRIIRDNVAARPSNIVYDETPIHVHMTRIAALLKQRGQLALSELLDPKLHKSALVGIFLAVLELVRHHRVKAEQNDLFGEIWILPAPDADLDSAQSDDWSDVDDYEYKPRGD